MKNGRRLQVLLSREEELGIWPRGSVDEAFALARKYPSDQMLIVQEGFDKEDLLGTQPVVQSGRTLLWAQVPSRFVRVTWREKDPDRATF